MFNVAILALRLFASDATVFIDQCDAGVCAIEIAGSLDTTIVPAWILPACAAESASVRGASCAAPTRATTAINSSSDIRL